MITQYETDSDAALAAMADVGSKSVLINGSQTIIYTGNDMPPAVPKASSVSMRQARLALLAAGALSGVDAAIAGMGEAARIEWEYARDVQRNSALIAGLGPLLGMSDAQIDGLFALAATL